MREWRALAATRAREAGREAATMAWFCRANGSRTRDPQLKLGAKGEPAEAG